MTRCAALACAIAAIALVSACGGSSSDTDTAAQADTAASSNVGDGKTLCAVAFVNVGTTPIILGEIKKMAGELGMKYKELVANGDFNAALGQIDSCVRQKAGAIISIAIENDSAKAAIARAAAANVPYISEWSGPPVEGVTLAIHGDEKKGSADLADWVGENLGPEQKIVMFTASALKVVKDRTEGFKDAFKDHPGFTLLDLGELDLEAPAKSATELTQAALQRYPDTTLVVAPWDEPAARSALTRRCPSSRRCATSRCRCATATGSA